MVVIMILGVLAAVLIPAVNAARESARQTTCLANLRQLGLALSKYESANERFPAGRDGEKFRQHSWATRVLPYLEELPLYELYDFRTAWNGLASSTNRTIGHENRDEDELTDNHRVAETDLSVFSCPSTYNRWQGATDYGGIYGSTLTGRPPGFAKDAGWDSGILVPVDLAGLESGRRKSIRHADIRDGLSKTVIVAEDAGRWPMDGGKWANGHQCFGQDKRSINVERSNEIYSDHPGGANILLADAAAKRLSADTDAQVIGSLCLRDDGH